MRSDRRHATAEYSTPKADGYYENTNEHILGFVPATAKTILDVGCAAGALGRELKERGNDVTVHGIEFEHDAARKAEALLDRVFETDLNRGLPPLEHRYDCIVFGDVLEHLIDPWTVLRSLCDVLAEGGCVVAGLPNVRHYKVLRDLVWRGRFEYRGDGIMDATHLRFFTVNEMESLFRAAGLRVTGRRPRIRGRNALLRLVDSITGGRIEEFRAVQYTLVGERM